MKNRLVLTLCSVAAAASLAVCVYAMAIHHHKRKRKTTTNAKRTEEKPQNKFKHILVDNSYSPFLHLHHQHGDGDGDTAQVSHPYKDEIRFLLEHPSHPLQFSSITDPLSWDGPYKWIQERSELEVLSQLLSQERVFAVDTEQHSLRSFLGFTALIQISTQTEDYLLDAIALHDDMELLQSVFANPQICKVFHGADSDILWLQRDFHIYVVNLFNTARACDVLGKPQRSLAYLLQTYCGISSNKIFQRADWRFRPLPDLMVEYARVDAHYLLYIADCLCAELNGNKMGEDALQNTCSDSAHSSLFEEVARRSNLITLQLYEKDGAASSGEAAAVSILSRYYGSQEASSYKYRRPRLKDGRFEQLVRELCIWRDFVVIKTYFGGRDITDKDLEAALLVGLGPREQRRLNKRRGLVLNHLKNSSGSLEGNSCRGSHVQTCMSERILATEEIGGVSPTIVESDICFSQDNQEIENVQDYINGTNKDKQVEASLFFSIKKQAEESIHCIKKGSETLSNENIYFEGGFCEQQKDMDDVIYAEDTGSDVVLKHSYNSCPSSPKIHHVAGSGYIGEEIVEPKTNNSRTSLRSLKISLLGHGPHGKRVVEKMLEEDGEDGIRQFCQGWRIVFVEAVKPRFLHSGWDIQHSGRREFGDYSVYHPSKKNVPG